MTDSELLSFIQKRGIQIWPQRASKHGPVLQWWVQNVSPFIQSYGSTLPEALAKLKHALDQQQL